MTKQGKKPKKQTRLHEIWVQLKRNKLAVVSMFVLIALVLVANHQPLSVSTIDAGFSVQIYAADFLSGRI